MDVKNFLQAPLVRPSCCSCSSLRLHNCRQATHSHSSH